MELEEGVSIRQEGGTDVVRKLQQVVEEEAAVEEGEEVSVLDENDTKNRLDFREREELLQLVPIVGRR